MRMDKERHWSDAFEYLVPGSVQYQAKRTCFQDRIIEMPHFAKGPDNEIIRSIMSEAFVIPSSCPAVEPSRTLLWIVLQDQGIRHYIPLT
jgi:hypothetical protein